MLLKEYSRDEIIFREGTVGHSLFKVIKGSVGVFIDYGKEGEVKLAELSEGRIFGEMAVLEAWPRSATVVAAQDHTGVLEIDSEEVEVFFREEPEQIREIMANLSHRLRELTQSYTEVCATISEMKETRGNKGSRKEGLLGRIGRILGFYKHISDNRRVIEAMEKYEKIESVKVKGEENTIGRSYREGDIIFRQGDEGDSMYFIGSGAVDIFIGYETDVQKLLTTLRADRFFGEMGLIEKLPRSATAVASENGTVVTKITEGDLNELFDKAPELVLMTLQHLSSRLRALTTDYVKACRTVAEMDEAEKEEKMLTEEEKQRIDYYIAMARAQSPWMMY